MCIVKRVRFLLEDSSTSSKRRGRPTFRPEKFGVPWRHESESQLEAEEGQHAQAQTELSSGSVEQILRPFEAVETVPSRQGCKSGEASEEVD